MTQSAAAAQRPAPEHNRIYPVIFWLLLFAFVVFVLSLPLFPTGDGGLHIYYATVFRDLITHRSPLYAQFYGVRHLVQPYLLHYYVFIGLRSFLSADAAEKIIVAVVLATLALGFRSLVRALSPLSPAVPLLVFPFLFSWPLAMGALNYTFAIGLLLFALGTYERFSLPGPVAPRLWRFVGLLLLLVFSHPVPLLLLIGVLAVDLLLRWWQSRTAASVWTAQRTQLLALALSCVSFIVPILIADKSEVGKSFNQIYPHWGYLRQIYNASRLTMFFIPDARGRLYNKLFWIVFPVSVAFVVGSGLFPRLRRRSLTSFDRLALFSCLFLLVTLLAPEEMNGSAYFAYRLWLPCWLLGTAACSGALRGARWNGLAATYAVLLALVSLGFAQVKLRPVARHAAELERASVPTGKLGLFVQSLNGDSTTLLDVSYPVTYWNAGRLFAEHGDVLLNSAWLYLTIIPVRENGNAGLLRDYTERKATENPNILSSYLPAHPVQRARALGTADFILFVDPNTSHPDPEGLARQTLGEQQTQWSCRAIQDYAICEKAQQSGSR